MKNAEQINTPAMTDPNNLSTKRQYGLKSNFTSKKKRALVYGIGCRKKIVLR
jgi:hypothetical protein